MPSPSYTPTAWVDDAAPALSAANLNHAESGIENAHVRIDAIGSATGANVGDIKMSAALTPPTGWLDCDGSAVSRATYSALFTAIGTAYGAGDGSTTFNLPDLRGRMPVGLGTHVDVDARGDNEGAAVADRRPKHKHTVNDPGHNHNGQQFFMNGGGTLLSPQQGGGNNGMQTVATDQTDITVGPQTNVPTDSAAFLVVKFFIKT